VTRHVIMVGAALFAFFVPAADAQAARKRAAPAAPRVESVNELRSQGHARMAAGDPRAAIALFRRALGRAPNSTELLFDYGRASLQAGLPAETLRALTAATRIESENPDYLHVLGLGQLWVADLESAAVSLGRAAQLAPERIPLLLAYAVALHGSKEYGLAATYLERVLALDPRNVEALYLLGDIAQIRGDLTLAEELAQRVLASDPRHPGANLVMGLALAKRGEYEGARAALESAAAGDPDYARTQYHLSQVYARLGDEARAAAARAAYQESVRKTSEQRQALRRLLDPQPAKDKP